jgi:hypothetical protein
MMQLIFISFDIIKNSTIKADVRCMGERMIAETGALR